MLVFALLNVLFAFNNKVSVLPYLILPFWLPAFLSEIMLVSMQLILSKCIFHALCADVDFKKTVLKYVLLFSRKSVLSFSINETSSSSNETIFYFLFFKSHISHFYNNICRFCSTNSFSHMPVIILIWTTCT